MGLLITGVVVWAGVHLFPALASGPREALIARLGRNPYRGLFSLLILGALAMMVLGWRSAAPTAVYSAPLAAGPVPATLVFFAFVLFFAARAPTNIKRVLRHPQLTGVLVWAAAHLLCNGSDRDLALFGGLGLWAMVDILACNRRDGQWTRPAKVSNGGDAVVVIIGAVIYAVVLYFHGRLFGVSPLA
jgi:uncharacterized membrane protein